MKKFLRMLSIAMALVMCFTMVFTTAVSAEGTTPAITLGDAKTALAGDTITIPVTLEGFAAAGIVGAEFNVDLGGLEYVSNDAVVDGEAVANYADGVVRYADVPGDVTDGEVAPYEDGTLFTITATIPADAETDATYTVTVSDVVAATSAEEKVEVTGGEVVITVGSSHTCVFGDLQYKVEDGNCITYRVCDCGEVETLATVANYDLRENAVVSDGLALKFRVTTADFTDYTSYKGVFTKDLYTGDTVTGTDVTPLDSYVENAKYTTFLYTGIASYEMTSNIHVNVYGIDANGYEILISDYDYCFVDYLSTLYTNAQFKTFVADIANYGAYAQIFATYNTSNLANANTPEGLASALPETFENIETTATGVTITPTVVLGNSVKYRYRIKKNDVASYSDLSLKVTYIDAYNDEQTAVYTADQFTTYKKSGVEYWQIEFDKLIAAQINQPLNVVLCAGETEIATVSYGFEAYAQTQLENYGSETAGFGYNCLMLCRAVVAYSRTAAELYS